jgi:predicted Zn-dependent protease
LGELDEAALLIDRALKLEPASRDVHFQSARLRMKKAKPAAAAIEGEAALKLPAGDTTDRQIHFLLVQAYRTLGRETDAARHAAAIREADDK